MRQYPRQVCRSAWLWHRWVLAGLFGGLLLAGLAGCGAADGAVDPCAAGVATDVCQPTRIQHDLDAALDWYLQQAREIEQQGVYPSAMAAELETYYTGDLLFRTRETIAANAAAGRAVAGTWQRMAPLGAAVWHDEPGVAWMTMRVQGYRRIEIPADPDRPDLPLAGGMTQLWRFGLVYDPVAQRWKIAYASRTGD